MSKKVLSVLLTFILFCTTCLPCYANESADSGTPEDNQNHLFISDNWEDYRGDLETFVYGLIINELKYKYDVFPAYVDLPDGNAVHGMAYTDYSNCYASEDEKNYCFEAGFIPYYGELEVSQSDFDSGLTIHNLDYSNDTASFVWAFGSESFTEHCVVYKQYLRYGIDSKGKITYTAEKYTRGQCDESLGSLYSFDEAKYLLDLDVGTYKYVNGASLFSRINFEELEAEINRILETQELNFASVDIETCAYIAGEAIDSYLLSLQEETFLGYNVQELIEAASKLDPLECYRITENGLITLKISDKEDASSTVRWLYGIGCGIVVATAMVGSIVFIECPPLSALSSAVAGTAIEIFMQVAVSGEKPENINWNQVAIAAVTGAVSGFLGPYVAATYQGAAYVVADSLIDGLVGSIEYSVRGWMEGKRGLELVKSFGFGAICGFGISVGFKGVGALLSKAANKVVAPAIKKLSDKVFPKLSAKTSSLSDFFSRKLYTLKDKVDSSIFHSKYISEKITRKQLQRLAKDGSTELLDKSMNQLSPSDLVDGNGNALKKNSLYDMFKNAKDGDTFAYIKKGNEIIEVVKKNGMVGIKFDASKYQSVLLPNGLTPNRSDNFEAAAKALKQNWLDNQSLIPESIANSIKASGIDLEAMSPKRLATLISQNKDFVLHENIDFFSVTLAPRVLHEGTSHMGGVGLAQFMKSHMGMEFFDRFVSAAATGVVQAVN